METESMSLDIISNFKTMEDGRSILQVLIRLMCDPI